MPREIELKLEIDPEAAERLLVQSWLCDGRCEAQPQLSVHYDTPDGEIRRRGFTLRVRSVGDRYVQTVKTLAAGAGLFERGEWEYEIGGIELDRQCLSRTPLAHFESAELERIIRSKVTRRSCRVVSDGSEIQLDYDDGEVSAGGRSEPISELELELLDGDPSIALRLARRIGDREPVRLGVMSKAERGFALADGRLGKVFKAEPVAIRPGMAIAEGFATIVAACVRHFRLNEPFVISERSPQALHQSRVALRRLRAAFWLFRTAISDSEFVLLRDELRWFTRKLGDARNLDVFLQREHPQSERRRLERHRDEAYDRVVEAMDSRRCRLLMLDIIGWSSLGEWAKQAIADRPIEPYVSRRIDRLWAKFGHARQLAHMSEEERHRLRIKAKKLRYALEFVAALHVNQRERQRKFAKGIEDLQETLGQLNDLAVARTLVAADAWPIELHEPDEAERALLHDAGRSLDHLRGAGPYWREADD
ncbi:MAG TPA: CHAD domain-containing protein [Sphingomicrobium sp.]|nr:CHAD domain-containing protein [Sphingomicrobium sp.]